MALIAFEGWEAGTKHNIYIISTTASIFSVTNDPVMAFDRVWKPVAKIP